MGEPGRKPGTRESVVDLMTIGEFAREARLSQKALRHYDELGLLAPARVDPDSGYRFYRPDQLAQASLVASLRQIGVSLAEIKVIIGLPPAAAADRIGDYWAGVERDHEVRRLLADHLVNRLSGKRSVMYDVVTREIPHRSLLCLTRHVNGQSGVWAFGKEFIGIFKERPLARMEGAAGATFCIFYGEVSEDGDGPLEWCRPVPEDEAEQIASQYPELELRTEAAHEEAVVHLAFSGETSPAQWQLISETLHSWSVEENRELSGLGVRVVYRLLGPESAGQGPDCDFAAPLR
jgi:DNA-binding transcriptional MerR regulator